MMLSGVGTIGVYNYNTKAGILSSKNGEAVGGVASGDVGSLFDRYEEFCSPEEQAKVNALFPPVNNLQYKRRLKKKREERELKERRERKEREEEALEAYAKYRRELRHYYNELGYQKKLAISNEDLASSVNVKRPPVVSAAYEMMMLLGM